MLSEVNKLFDDIDIIGWKPCFELTCFCGMLKRYLFILLLLVLLLSSDVITSECCLAWIYLVAWFPLVLVFLLLIMNLPFSLIVISGNSSTIKINTICIISYIFRCRRKNMWGDKYYFNCLGQKLHIKIQKC